MNNSIRTSDGELLSVKLKKAESNKRNIAFLLVLPLLLFILVAYILPISQMLQRSIDNTQMNSLLSETYKVIQDWNGEELPPEEVTKVFYNELKFQI